MEKLDLSHSFGRLAAAFWQAPIMDIPGSGLTCQVGFWAPLDPTEVNYEQKRKDREESIEGHLKSLNEKLRTNTELKWPECTSTPVFSSHVVEITFYWRSIPVTVQFEKHTEYSSLSFFMNLHNISSCDRLVNELLLNFKTLKALAVSGDAEMSSYGDCYIFLYNTIWKRFSSEVFGWEDPVNASFEGIASINFTNFRGIILDIGKISGAQHQPVEWSQRTLENVWPFMLSEPREALNKSHFTACGMLGGAALFVSALGPKMHTTTGDEGLPVCNLICSSTHNSAQVGALVNDLRRMGTARLASIQEAGKLLSARRTFPSVRMLLNHARKLLHENAFEHAEGIHGMLDNVTSTFERSDTGICGGIMHRVSRSTYYLSQFEARIERLGIISLNNCVQYDKFVYQMIGDTFRIINDIGVEHERLEDEQRRLRESLVIGLAAKIVEGISEKTEAIKKENTEIEKAQAVGEIVLFGILVPHYLASSLVESLESWASIEKQGYIAGSVWGAAWGLGVFLAIGSVASHYPDHAFGALANSIINTVDRWLNSPIFLLVSAIALFGVLWGFVVFRFLLG